MRRPLTYANVVATVALVFAMSGGALAANHYLINSTRQINPKVLKKLKGSTGKQGPPGATGAQGKEGPQGKQGVEGKPGPPPEAVTGSNVKFSGAPKAAEVVLLAKLPPGTYMMLASTEAENASAATAEVECTFVQGGDAFDSATVKPDAKESAHVALPAVLVRVEAEGESVDFACKSTTTEGAYDSPTVALTKLS